MNIVAFYFVADGVQQLRVAQDCALVGFVAYPTQLRPDGAGGFMSAYAVNLNTTPNQTNYDDVLANMPAQLNIRLSAAEQYYIHGTMVNNSSTGYLVVQLYLEALPAEP